MRLGESTVGVKSRRHTEALPLDGERSPRCPAAPALRARHREFSAGEEARRLARNCRQIGLGRSVISPSDASASMTADTLMVPLRLLKPSPSVSGVPPDTGRRRDELPNAAGGHPPGEEPHRDSDGPVLNSAFQLTPERRRVDVAGHFGDAHPEIHLGSRRQRRHRTAADPVAGDTRWRSTWRAPRLPGWRRFPDTITPCRGCWRS